MTLLFSPITIGNNVIRNRLWVAPMCQYSSQDGMPNDWHHVHLAQFASGGAGLVMAEAAAIVPEGRISPQDVGIWNDDQRDAWRRIVAAISARGATPAIQLAHAGRKASNWSPFSGEHGSVPAEAGGWQTVAPSAIAYEGFAEPRELTGDEIEGVIADFRRAARRAVDAGFRAVEVHAAHGYLLHEFLSPLSNTRTDEWGGSLENRARVVVRVVAEVRDEVGQDIAIFVRFSATDAAPGGLEAADVAVMGDLVIAAGADLLDISSGGLVKHQQITAGPGYQVPLAKQIREHTGALTGAVGMITSGAQAEDILLSGDADVILAAREFLRDPHFALRAAGELGVDPTDIWPPQYLRGWRAPRADRDIEVAGRA